jgi:diguanylate cyclase (GGDEF)-like protein/PAS domain S-box-containing protein
MLTIDYANIRAYTNIINGLILTYWHWGLGASWSEPIFSSKKKVLGAFAIYHRDIHSPTTNDLILIEQTADLASIAIEKNQADKALKASDERWKFALEGSGCGAWQYDFQGNVNLVSTTITNMLGIESDLIHEEFWPFNEWQQRLHPDSIDLTMEAFANVANGKSKDYQVEQQVRCEDGHYIWLLSRGRLISQTINGEPLLMVGITEDITERKQSELKLQLAASVFSHAREAIMITEVDGNIIEVNDTFTHITGYTREEAIGNTPRLLQSGKQSSDFYKAMWQSLLEKGYWHGEVWNRRKGGELYAEILTISAVKNPQGETNHYVALFTDITHIKEHQAQLEHIAHYDMLTNLPNRVLLADRLSQSVVQCERRHSSLAVVFLDLDGFKAVNDSHGHDIGDELLVALSHRMQAALREGDTLSRFGGDEFIVVLVDLEETEDCIPVLDRLLLAASEPVMINDIRLQVSASIGVTVYPQDSADASAENQG